MRTTKRCPRCSETKPLADFLRPRAGTPSDYCHPCRQAKRRKEYEAAGGSTSSYGQHLQRYGLTLAQFDELDTAQDGRCAVCRLPEPVRLRSGLRRRLAVDFDQATRTVRGLVCSRCIVLVKAAVEDADLLAAAQAYLEAAGQVRP